MNNKGPQKIEHLLCTRHKFYFTMLQSQKKVDAIMAPVLQTGESRLKKTEHLPIVLDTVEKRFSSTGSDAGACALLVGLLQSFIQPGKEPELLRVSELSCPGIPALSERACRLGSRVFTCSIYKH